MGCISSFVKELVALQPDAILARSTPVTAALLRETTSIPIVFLNVSDPVGRRVRREHGAPWSFASPTSLKQFAGQQQNGEGSQVNV